MINRAELKNGALKSCEKKQVAWIVLLAALLWSVFDVTVYEPRYPVLTTYEVEILNLPKALDGLRMVQLF